MITTALNRGAEPLPSFPVFQTREEMDTYLRGLGYRKMEQLKVDEDAVGARERLAEALKKTNPDADVDQLIEHLKLNSQEIERKEKWYDKAMKLPKKAASYTWETIKAHPILTALTLAGLTVWQFPNVFKYLETSQAGIALEKANQYFKSFLPMTGGTTAGTPPDVFQPLPYSG